MADQVTANPAAEATHVDSDASFEAQVVATLQGADEAPESASPAGHEPAERAAEARVSDRESAPAKAGQRAAESQPDTSAEVEGAEPADFASWAAADAKASAESDGGPAAVEAPKEGAEWVRRLSQKGTELDLRAKELEAREAKLRELEEKLTRRRPADEDEDDDPFTYDEPDEPGRGQRDGSLAERLESLERMIRERQEAEQQYQAQQQRQAQLQAFETHMQSVCEEHGILHPSLIEAVWRENRTHPVTGQPTTPEQVARYIRANRPEFLRRSNGASKPQRGRGRATLPAGGSRPAANGRLSRLDSDEFRDEMARYFEESEG